MKDINLLEEIKRSNQDIFKNVKVVKKLNVGFTNEVYMVDDKYILKICGDKSNEYMFNNEIDFYLKNHNNKYIPELYAYHKATSDNDASYLVIQKLNGKSLYYVWHTFSDVKRKQVISELSEMMKSFHSIKRERLNWNKYISDKIKNSLDICCTNKVIDDEIYQKVIRILNKSSKYLDSNEFVLVHSDIHFDNIIYTDNGNLKIIDFETSISAPIDYELDIFLRMCNNPFKYASEETEKYVKISDYQNLEMWMREFYPEMFSNKYYDIRMKFYDLESNLRLLPKFSSNKELKQLVTDITSEIEDMVY